jgi:hypothetical protein
VSKPVEQTFLGKLWIFALAVAALWWGGSAAFVRLNEISRMGDLTGDGQFSMVDIPNAIWNLFLAAGDQFQAVLARTDFFRFFEMSVDEPRWAWSFVLSSGLYLFGLSGLILPFTPSTSEVQSDSKTE